MQTILISPSQATENVVSSQICIFYTPINGKNPYKPSRPYKNVSKFGLSGPLLPLKPTNPESFALFQPKTKSKNEEKTKQQKPTSKCAKSAKGMEI